MGSKPVLEDFEAWRDANQPRVFTMADYVHGVFKAKRLPSDLFVALVELAWPEFVEVEGLIFLGDQFSSERFDGLVSQGLERSQLEYWMNLCLLDGLLDPSSKESSAKVVYVARRLAGAWRAKLALDFPERSFEVTVIDDSETGDVGVVFSQSVL